MRLPATKHFPLVLSIISRFSVVALLCALALSTEYLNLKVGYNNARLVELSSGATARWLYEAADALYSVFGDPVDMAQRTGGMTWSVRLLGIPFTDPVAFLSVLMIDHTPAIGFTLGVLIPLTLALTLGRVFCSYVCPASLVFFAIGRLRLALSGFFYFPDIHLPRGIAWGILVGGLGGVVWAGHGLWTLILPYFAMGQTIFHAIAFGTLSVTISSLVLFGLLDLFVGYQFTCRFLCPTGRLLGAIGRRALYSVRRDAARCLEPCTACGDVCPFEVDPKFDQTRDCSMCGACLVICPTECLTIGRRRVDGASTANTDRDVAIRDVATRDVAIRQVAVALVVVLAMSGLAHAHHFKGLPHFNYFENYPQIPQDEFVGQEGKYEFSLVLYDFQGLQQQDMEQPDDVRLFVIAFNLLGNTVYSGAARLEVLDGDVPVVVETVDGPREENVYKIRGSLSGSGRYSLRMTLIDDEVTVVIPFELSSQKTAWGRWTVGALVALIAFAAVGARRARVLADRKQAR